MQSVLPIDGMFLPAEPALRFGYLRVADNPSTPANEQHVHQGVDIYAPIGTPIRAAAPGTVVLVHREPVPRPPAGISAGGYGAQVVLHHANGTLTRYAHMLPESIPSELRVGSAVEMRAPMGRVGNTRWAWIWVSRTREHRFVDRFTDSESHLHWETLTRWPARKERDREDPEAWLRRNGTPFCVRRRAVAGSQDLPA